MMMTDAKGSIGVTFLSQYPLTDAYYRLRSINSSSFHISAHPDGKEVFGVVDSGVIPAINQWYRFRIQVQDSGIRTEILAKVWNESLPEPSDWQINAYDDTFTRLVAGTFGLWSYSSGYKYWDDLKIINFNTIINSDEDNTSDTNDQCPNDPLKKSRALADAAFPIQTPMVMAPPIASTIAPMILLKPIRALADAAFPIQTPMVMAPPIALTIAPMILLKPIRALADAAFYRLRYRFLDAPM
jgi:hypothetical protein